MSQADDLLGNKEGGSQFRLTRRSFLSKTSLFLASLGALSLESAFDYACAANSGDFSFAFIEGVHLSSGIPDNVKLLAESQLFLQNALKTVSEQAVDFVLFGGDQVESPGRDDTFWQLFIDVVQVLNCPWYFVFGEQDITGAAPVDRMRTYGPDLKGRGMEPKDGGPECYWSLDPVPGVHLIGLDSAKANSNAGFIKQAQLDWLKKDLRENRGKLTIAVSHHPLLPPPPYDSGPPWEEFIVEQGAQTREVLGASKDVRLVLSGHVGINKIQKERDIWYVSCPSLTVYPCQFKIFRVKSDGILVETYQITYEALVKKAKRELSSSRVSFQYSSRKPLSFLKVVEGEELDRNVFLPFAPGALPLKAPKKKKAPKQKASKASVDKKKTPTSSQQKSDIKPQTAPVDSAGNGMEKLNAPAETGKETGNN
ncbi:MAG: Calcineurin-like phosphoesterase [bacterium ADurb.Bin425]|nr:MAG: Calcineurin-like phosphoesterase [bacterium ADurb.Bin425]